MVRLRRYSRLVTAAAFLVLVACGGSPGSDEGTAGPGGDDIRLLTDTHLVANPPTYPSVPLPEGLDWVTNEADPVFTSPHAKRGGTFTTYLESFPLTLRSYGPDQNSGDFVGTKRSMTLGLVELHPNTGNYTPALATQWAFDPDGRTVYYRLDPAARWSDGEPVTADDYLFARNMLLSEYVIDPYAQNYLTEEVVDVRKHDDYTISIVGATAKPREELLTAYSIEPLPRHFHVLDENWVTDYNWRVEPNTGPYDITAVEKGRYIELTRKQDWWGDDLTYFRNRWNADKIRFEIIRDANVAYEHFLRGELDRYLFATLPARWHERARGSQFDNGYIDRIEYYTDRPRPQRGLWLNQDDPLLADRNVRLGLAHAVNMDRVLATIFRGDYKRLRTQYEGYFWGYSHPTLHPREFDIAKADAYFDEAGWTERGPDGIRVKNGRRLSVRISYGTDEHSPWLVVLREEARKAGIELNLQLLDPATWGTQVGEKKFQIVVLTFSPNTFAPSFWQGYHSDNAHIPQTNNITNTDIPELDALIDEYDAATDLATRVPLAHRIEEIIWDNASMIPLYEIPFIRETFWRWLELPEQHATRTSNEVFEPVGSEPFVGGLFWIDEDAKAETQHARAEGRRFEPVDIVDTTWRTP